MAKKKVQNPGGFAKACASRLKKLLKHIKLHPNDTKNITQVKEKIRKCESGSYRK